MKVYKLYFAKPLLAFYLLMLGAWVFAGLVGIIVGIVGKLGSDGPPVWGFVILLGGALFNAYSGLLSDFLNVFIRVVFGETILATWRLMRSNVTVRFP